MLMLWKDASKYFRNGLREQNSNSWYILWIQSFNFRYHFGIYCNAIWFVRNRVVLPGVIVRIPWITILINYFIFSDFLREIKNISRIFWYYPYWCPKHFWLSNIRMVSVIFCYKIIIMFIKAWSQEWAILITITFVDSLLPGMFVYLSQSKVDPISFQLHYMSPDSAAYLASHLHIWNLTLVKAIHTLLATISYEPNPKPLEWSFTLTCE